MDRPTYDIVISGAGPAGSALALILAGKSSRPERIALLGRQFRASPKPDDSVDPRTLALNHGSRVLLEQINGWPAESASIHTVHVSQRGRLGRTLIKHDELGVPQLGSVVAYDALLETLHQRLQHSGITLLESATTPVRRPGHLAFEANGSTLSSALAIQSDGAKPQGIERHYKQHAVLATVQASQPRKHWAFERFTRQGPLAILPHPQGNNLYGVVWCCAPEQARHLQSLTDTEFAIELNAMFGERLGRFQCVGARHVFPLSMHAGPSLINDRSVAIGNAAQTLHPVAGQGLNLGLRDAAQLGQALAPWLAQTNTDPRPLLARFASLRRPDRWLTAGITDFLPRIFSTGNPLIEHAGGLALLALDLAPPLRTPLARHLLQGLRN
ncbi:FAD-dependent monooxygenase [Pollutimonas harenae]|uniref:FAD-dependent monooxygenase n=1 Tax=Pollutimonas harenae TaxID=657015 RepID=A0A853GX70_9BURK|nr:FAD-dependent monooxygenase [Pollutimonas harenae]NYT85346.1 FAD-dependent monooxygenase [Pollutimonas harenae]TEA70448.1 monooxygenase [Pollutimonas harenae]